AVGMLGISAESAQAREEVSRARCRARWRSRPPIRLRRESPLRGSKAPDPASERPSQDYDTEADVDDQQHLQNRDGAERLRSTRSPPGELLDGGAHLLGRGSGGQQSFARVAGNCVRISWKPS